MRKLILEIFLRLSLSESVRQFARELQKLLLGVILHDNEENSLLAIKILIEHIRGFRLQFNPEVCLNFIHIYLPLFRSLAFLPKSEDSTEHLPMIRFKIRICSINHRQLRSNRLTMLCNIFCLECILFVQSIWSNAGEVEQT
jgi:hypothetical protein